MVEGMLGGLFGGPDDDRVRSQAQDFVSRYDSGPPQEGYSNDEVRDRFKQVYGRVNDADMQDAARESFRRMSPEQRKEYRRAMRQHGARQFDGNDNNDDPDVLAQATQGFMKEQPQQSGGGLGGMLSGLFGDHELNQPQVQQRQAQGGSMLENPAVKAAMAGMAAFAMKKMMDQR